MEQTFYNIDLAIAQYAFFIIPVLVLLVAVLGGKVIFSRLWKGEYKKPRQTPYQKI
jgi:hypothetical protein